MIIYVNCAKCVGIDAVPVTVEIDITTGIGLHLVGLADVAVKESLLRTITALQSLDYHIPGKKIVINLAPADMHKKGSGYDLPIALGVIAASEQAVFPNLDKYLVMGELGLDGSVRDVPGALPIVEMASKMGLKGVILPLKSALEAVEIDNVNLYGVTKMDDVVRILEEVFDSSDLLARNSDLYRKESRNERRNHKQHVEVDFAEIMGQDGAKRGMEIAAAGGHNMIMIGPPGSGKSSMAKAMAGILPPMGREEAVVTSKIYSVAGKGGGSYGLMRERPFRAPHYSASLTALLGGGSGENICPGEVSLANNGVLFLDEFAQMPRSVIEAMRGPLEDREITISRLKSKVTYPSSFILVAATNPCPCGYYGEGDRCICTVGQRAGYLSRLSGPIMDRIDVQVWMHPVAAGKLVERKMAEPSSEIAERVLKARIVQKHRFVNEPIFVNAEMNPRQIEKYCRLTEDCKTLLSRLIDTMGLSARAVSRIVKVARTIADLAEENDILPPHLAEAASFRFLDKRNPLGID
ncbi:MAG: YifB family Mg chelatase-like AAA ATPase [Bacteroidales bacterium]|nr:YifB family Mg chelatase-like AAA ATPase [Bacteroidales bacterium]